MALWPPTLVPQTSPASAKDFTSNYMKVKQLQSILYNYFDSCTSRPNYTSSPLCPCPATDYLHHTPLFSPIASQTASSNSKPISHPGASQQLPKQPLYYLNCLSYILCLHLLPTLELSLVLLSISTDKILSTVYRHYYYSFKK